MGKTKKKKEMKENEGMRKKMYNYNIYYVKIVTLRIIWSK